MLARRLAACLLSGLAIAVLAAAPPADPLKPLGFDALQKNIADSDAKFTLVDCWASWCGPCKENYPDLNVMDKKYRGKGLRVIAVALDGGNGDETYDKKEIAAAEKFVAEQKPTFDNFLLDEERDMMFEKFDISTIPAVFVYDADGKEIKRYTWDDPNNQFTYEQVEKDVAALFSAKP